MKLSQLISISTVYAAAEGASTQGRRPRREAPSITCPPSWVLDPNDSTKCLPDAGKTDFDINCGPSSMMLTFNYNHLYENIESFLDGNMYENTSTSPIGLYTNGKDACNIIRAGSYVDGKFTLSIDYTSSCVTLYHGKDRISVSTTIKGHTNLATSTDYDNGVEVHVGQVLSFAAVCSWADTETVEVGALSVTTADFSPNAGTADEGDAGYTAFVPTFSIYAYRSNDRSPALNVADDSVEIGEKVYFSISSDQTVETGGTFEWYVTDCTVYSEADAAGSSYPIIKDNSQCGSTFLDASTDSKKWQASSANSFVHLDFIAFQFAQAETGQSIHLQCNIKMCLASEDCQPTCSTCDDGYHCMSPLAA